MTQRANRRADGFLDDVVWRAWLHAPFEGGQENTVLRRQTRTGRLCGIPGFTEQIEKRTGRALRPKRRGPKPGTQYEHREVA